MTPITKIMLANTLLLVLALASCQSPTLPEGKTDLATAQAIVASEEGAWPASTVTAIPTVSPPPSPTSKTTPVLSLRLALADSDWDGERIPDGQQCKRQGGEDPSTPSILVGEIPEGSSAIILEFSDRTFRPMDDGGHGKIGFTIAQGMREKVIPSVPGHTFDLPEGFFLVQSHLAPSFDTAGAYMPPCSGGGGHSYYVTVKAVAVLSLDDNTFNVLGQGILELGEY